MYFQALVLTLMLGAGACARSVSSPLPASVARLESLVLSRPVPGSSTWLLAGRYETTRGEYGVARRPSEEDLPVTMVSFHEAETWCRERHLRLPSLSEWRHVANSGREEFWVAETARNGLSLRLRRALPVGVFERGRTSLGAYDMLGNVREWAKDPSREKYYACGGSYAAREASTAPEEQLELLPEDRAEDVGFRYFADAEAYMLTEVIPWWSELSPEQKDFVQMVVAAWPLEARTALADLLRRQQAPEGFCRMLAQP